MPRVQLGFDQGLVEALSKRRCTKSTSCPRPGRRGPGGGTSSTYSTTMATGTRRSSTTSGPSAESWGSRYGRGPQTRGGEAERRPDGPASDLVSGFSQQGDGASFEGTWELMRPDAAAGSASTRRWTRGCTRRRRAGRRTESELLRAGRHHHAPGALQPRVLHADRDRPERQRGPGFDRRVGRGRRDLARWLYRQMPASRRPSSIWPTSTWKSTPP